MIVSFTLLTHTKTWSQTKKKPTRKKLEKKKIHPKNVLKIEVIEKKGEKKNSFTIGCLKKVI